MRAVVGAVVSIVVVSCSGAVATKPIPSPSAAGLTPVATPAATTVECGTTTIARGGNPEWLDSAGAHNNPLFLRYVVARPALAAGFLFADPLRAGHPVNPANKILWVVRTDRNGTPLVINGHPLNATSPRVHTTQEANSSPGEIYPSVVDVPTAGCWQFDLQWANSQAQVELNYAAP
jgi:hypothetical protein